MLPPMRASKMRRIDKRLKRLKEGANPNDEGSVRGCAKVADDW
jgi:hypothetical protein